MAPVLRFALFCLLAGAGSTASAAYRCEANGRVIYSDAPCPGGRQVDLNLTPGGSLSEKEAGKSREQLKQNKKELERLRKERHKREAVEEKEQKKAAREQAKKRKRCDNLAMRKKWAEDDARASVGKASERARLKASRLAEQYAMECR
jgi:sRNA-binding protein